MRKTIEFMNDFKKCFIIGTLITFLIAFFVGIFSLIISKFNIEQAIQNVKSILLIVGSLGMILGAMPPSVIIVPMILGLVKLCLSFLNS